MIELGALFGVGDGHVEGGTGNADHLRGRGHGAGLQQPLQRRIGRGLTQQFGGRVVEFHPAGHAVGVHRDVARQADPRGRQVAQEQGGPAIRQAGGHRECRRRIRGRDQDFAAPQAPAADAGRGSDRNRIRPVPGTGFGMGEGKPNGAGGDLRQPHPALLRRSEPGDDLADQDGVHQWSRHQRTAKFLERQNRVHHAEPGATLGFRHQQGLQAEGAQPLPQVRIEPRAGGPQPGGAPIVGQKAAHAVAQEVLVLGKIKVHAPLLPW